MAECRGFPAESASGGMGPSLPTCQPPCSTVPLFFRPQLFRCLWAPSGDLRLSPQPQASLAPPVPSLLTSPYTQPHALLISSWSQDGQGWCQGRLWALLRDLCRPGHALGHLFSSPPSPLSPRAQSPALSGWPVLLRSPKDWDDKKGNGEALGEAEGPRWAS